MSNELQTVIDAAWEKRDGISSATKGAGARRRRGGDRRPRRRQLPHRREIRRRMGREPVAEEGRPALLPALRFGADGRRRRRSPAWARPRGSTRCRSRPRAGTPSASPRPASAPCRARSCAAAPTWRPPSWSCRPSSISAPMSTPAPWSTPGRRSARAPRSARTAISRAASASAACSSRLQANPVIVEDNCFIGARSEVVEGVIVGTGSVLSMGVFISANTRIVDRETGQIHVGKVPPYSVVHPGTMGGSADRPARLLRDHHKDGRRAHAVEDLDQRALARLSRSGDR